MKHEMQMTDLCEARKLIYCCTNAALKKKKSQFINVIKQIAKVVCEN